MAESTKIPTLKAAALVNPAEMATPGTLREGPRRVFVAGARRRVAVHVIERLLAAPEVDLVLGVDRGACPPALLGCDPERFIFASADLRASAARSTTCSCSIACASARSTPSCTWRSRATPRATASRATSSTSTRRATYWTRACATAWPSTSSCRAMRSTRSARAPTTRCARTASSNLDPDVHPILRDTIDAEFMCRAKMDRPDCEVMVLRPSGVFGGGVLSGVNLLFESTPPVPVGFDPHDQSHQQGAAGPRHPARDLLARQRRLQRRGPDGRAADEVPRGARHPADPRAGPALGVVNRMQRILGMTRYHADFHPKRLYFSLVLDDSRSSRIFRANANGAGAGAFAPTRSP
ncbi:MAG: hypothetical protein U0168_15915 [Nannocystaceae bacterium]